MKSLVILACSASLLLGAAFVAPHRAAAYKPRRNGARRPTRPETTDAMGRYLAAVRRCTMFRDKHVQNALVKQAKGGVGQAAHALIESNLLSAVSLAAHYNAKTPDSLHLLDLVQEGNLSLVEEKSDREVRSRRWHEVFDLRQALDQGVHPQAHSAQLADDAARPPGKPQHHEVAKRAGRAATGRA